MSRLFRVVWILVVFIFGCPGCESEYDPGSGTDLSQCFPFPIVKDGLIGYVNQNRRFVIEPRFSRASFFDGAFANVHLEGKPKVIERNGETYVDASGDEPYRWFGGVMTYRQSLSGSVRYALARPSQEVRTPFTTPTTL